MPRNCNGQLTHSAAEFVFVVWCMPFLRAYRKVQSVDWSYKTAFRRVKEASVGRLMKSGGYIEIANKRLVSVSENC